MALLVAKYNAPPDPDVNKLTRECHIDACSQANCALARFDTYSSHHVTGEPTLSIESCSHTQGHISPQDSFYKELTQEQLKLAFSNKYDFDHPDALDMPLFASVRTLYILHDIVCMY